VGFSQIFPYTLQHSGLDDQSGVPIQLLAKVKVKFSRYRPKQALGDPVG
jgi:hypothetical protein